MVLVCVFPRLVFPMIAIIGALSNSGILLVTGDANSIMYPVKYDVTFIGKHTINHNIVFFRVFELNFAGMVQMCAAEYKEAHICIIPAEIQLKSLRNDLSYGRVIHTNLDDLFVVIEHTCK